MVTSTHTCTLLLLRNNFTGTVTGFSPTFAARPGAGTDPVVGVFPVAVEDVDVEAGVGVGVALVESGDADEVGGPLDVWSPLDAGGGPDVSIVLDTVGVTTERDASSGDWIADDGIACDDVADEVDTADDPMLEHPLLVSTTRMTPATHRRP